jgi:hypothetical protein
VARTADKAECLAIRRMDGKHWSTVVTYLQDRIGIISVHRAWGADLRVCPSPSATQVTSWLRC